MKKLLLFIVLCVSTTCIFAQSHKLAQGITSYHNIFYKGIKEDVACYRIPALVTAKNGDIIAAIDERVPSCGDLKWSKDINIVVRRSSDNGKSWSNIETVIDYPFGQSASDPSMIVDEKTDDIFLFYNFMDLDKEQNVYYLHYVKSSDNGKTWGKPVDITSQISKAEWKNDFKFITSGRGFYTSDGKMLHTLVNLDHGLHVFGSDNHGESWYLLDKAIKPGDESEIIELSNGNWMINSRVNGLGTRYSHISSDKGKTWVSKQETSLADPSCNGSIISYTRISDGYDKDRLIFSNCNDSKNRKNLAVRISYDNGETWSEGKTIFEGSSAYSSLTVLENGDLAVFFEKDDYQSNAIVIFSLEWLTDGRDKYSKPTKSTK